MRQHDGDSDYPNSESTFPQSHRILAGVPDDEQAKIAAGNTARLYNFDAARLITTTVAKTPSFDDVWSGPRAAVS